jgi:hypothetical protein
VIAASAVTPPDVLSGGTYQVEAGPVHPEAEVKAP